MKNNITIFAALFLLLIVGVGCSFIDGFSSGGNSSNTASNSATNSTDPNLTAKTGVAECDELIDLLNRDRSDPNDDFLTRKVKEYAIDFAKESIKKNIEENKGDKTKIAQGCREARDQYVKNKDQNADQSNSANGNSQKP
ncbi:MAG TPA: hypothetical protein VIL74_05925 [Pyrinomonadaceae bacterium]|jgi:hypothetical protein